MLLAFHYLPQQHRQKYFQYRVLDTPWQCLSVLHLFELAVVQCSTRVLYSHGTLYCSCRTTTCALQSLYAVVQRDCKAHVSCTALQPVQTSGPEHEIGAMEHVHCV